MPSLSDRQRKSRLLAQQESTAELVARMRRKAEWERVKGGKGYLDDATADRLEELDTHGQACRQRAFNELRELEDTLGDN